MNDAIDPARQDAPDLTEQLRNDAGGTFAQSLVLRLARSGQNYERQAAAADAAEIDPLLQAAFAYRIASDIVERVASRMGRR